MTAIYIYAGKRSLLITHAWLCTWFVQHNVYFIEIGKCIHDRDIGQARLSKKIKKNGPAENKKTLPEWSPSLFMIHYGHINIFLKKNESTRSAHSRPWDPGVLKQLDRYALLNHNIYIAADLLMWTLTILRTRAIALCAHIVCSANHDVDVAY